MDLEQLLEPDLDLVSPELLQVVPKLQLLVGKSGARPEVEEELREAQARCGACREAWLGWECLWRALQELSCGQGPLGDDKELQLCLEPPKDFPKLGAAESPPPRRPLPPQLLPALEQHLGQKVRELELYHGGEEEEEKEKKKEKEEEKEESPGSQSGGGGVADALAADWLRLSQARRRQGELRRALGRVKENYLEVLSSSLSLLVDLLGVAEENAGLDEGHAHYLEVKAEAVLAKIRLEEIELLLATYPPPTLEAHRRIRSALEERRGQIRGEAELLRASLSAYQELGPSFTELAQQYQSLRQRLQERRWALSQLRPAPP